MRLKFIVQFDSGCLVKIQAGYPLLCCFYSLLAVSHEQKGFRVLVLGNHWVECVLLQNLTWPYSAFFWDSQHCVYGTFLRNAGLWWVHYLKFSWYWIHYLQVRSVYLPCCTIRPSIKDFSFKVKTAQCYTGQTMEVIKSIAVECVTWITWRI